MTRISPEALDFKCLRVVGKKLLYNCDLKIEKKEYGILASGHLRVGPLKGKVFLESKFDKKGNWLSYHIKADALKFWQKYELQSGQLMFSSSKNIEPLEVPQSQKNWRDPLWLLLKIKADHQGNDLHSSYWTFSGKKLTKIKYENGIFLRMEKPLFKIGYGPNTKVYIPQLKVDLEIFEALNDV